MEIHTLIYSLIVVAISGLTIIAYKHPVGYKKIYYSLLFPVSLTFLGSLSWNLSGINYHIRLLSDNLTNEPDSALEKFTLSINSLNDNQDALLLTITIGFFILSYLYFLYKLPDILETNKNDKSN